VTTRIHAVSDPIALDPTYVEGLRAAVTAAVDYGLAAIELGEERSPPPPPILLAQARLAARAGVGLDTVLRRYFAGHALLGDFLIEEAESSGLKGPALQVLLRTQASLFDRLVEAVSEEYGREEDTRAAGSGQRRLEQVERLLAGELVDASGLGYDFEGHHLALIAIGDGAAETVRDLACALDRCLLSVRRDETTVWAWFGGRRAADLEELGRLLSAGWPAEVILSLGEPAHGLAGWRLSHRQARATLPIALRKGEGITRYGDVALLASMLQDDLLASSLRELYLKPLERDRDGGEAARETLHAYFAAGRNASSAAAALGMSRQAVAKRLHAVEQRLERSLGVCSMELEAALHLDRFGGSATARHSMVDN